MRALTKLNLATSLLIVLCNTVGGAEASIFGQPVQKPADEADSTPEIQAAEQRVQETKAKLDQARRQLDAAKASLKAADAEFKAARADKEALSLRRQAEKLADASRVVSGGTDLASQSSSKASLPSLDSLPENKRPESSRIDLSGQAESLKSAPPPVASLEGGDLVTSGNSSRSLSDQTSSATYGVGLDSRDRQ